MGHEVSKAYDKVLGIQDAERTTYWCHLAMVRSDFQGKGIAKALFALAFGELKSSHGELVLSSLLLIPFDVRRTCSKYQLR